MGKAKEGVRLATNLFTKIPCGGATENAEKNTIKPKTGAGPLGHAHVNKPLSGNLVMLKYNTWRNVCGRGVVVVC